MKITVTINHLNIPTRDKNDMKVVQLQLGGVMQRRLPLKSLILIKSAAVHGRDPHKMVHCGSMPRLSRSFTLQNKRLRFS